ncbi:MAG: BamA/TamA family outer membrane protein [Candidatus Cloacimonadales bacterium]
MKKQLLLGILIFSLFSSLLAQTGYTIKDLNITGMENTSEAKLKKELTLQKKSVWEKLLFWKKANQYYEADLISDLEFIENFYQKEGFLDVQVDSEVKENSDKETVEIEFIVQENNPVLMEQINYKLQVTEPEDISKLQPLLTELKQDFPFKEGSRFRDEELLLVKNELENWLVMEGYAYQKVSYNLHLKKELNLVIIDFNLKTGPLCYFGETTFKGVEEVPYSILKKQLDPPGKIYSEKYLRNLQRKLQSLGMFQYVTVRGDLEEQHANPVPIQVNLKEALRYSVKFGVGYGQEDKFRTSITVTKLGFLGGIRKAVFYAKYSSLEPYNLSLKLTQPGLFYQNGTLILNPYVRKEEETNYTRSKMGSLVTYQLGLGRYMTTYLNYGIDWNNIKTASPLLEDDLISQGKGDYRQSSATIGLVYDDSEPMFSPLHGWYFSSGLTWGGIGFHSDYHYTKTSSEVRKYTTLYKQLVLAARVQGGFMKPLRSGEVTPIADRYYAGGSNSVRGWSRFNLGPKSADNLPLGGNSLLVSSVELRYPIWNILSGVVFCDAGNVWTGTYDHNLTQFKYSGGGGLRVSTPLGPIRVDVSTPFSESNKKIQFYLNIGEAF